MLPTSRPGLVVLGAGEVSGLPCAALELLVGARVLGEIILVHTQVLDVYLTKYFWPFKALIVIV